MKSGIYQIRNTVNNKCYIGKSINVIQRKRTHIYNLKLNKHGNRYLQFAFNKYGLDNFIFEVLEYCDINLLNKKEIQYIESNKPAYNLIQAEDDKLFCSDDTKIKMKDSKVNKNITISIYSYNIDTKELLKWDSIKECSKSLNIDRRWIQNILKGKKLSAKGYLFSHDTVFYIDDIMKVNVINIIDNTNILFENVNDCAKHFKLHKSYVYLCIRESITYNKIYKFIKID